MILFLWIRLVVLTTPPVPTKGLSELLLLVTGLVVVGSVGISTEDTRAVSLRAVRLFDESEPVFVRKGGSEF